MHLYLLFSEPSFPDLANQMGNFYRDALNWGVSASKGYLAFLGMVALAVALFKN